MKLIAQPRVVVALELGPELLRLHAHDYPELIDGDRAKTSDVFWRSFLADTGLTDVTPVVLGNWHVAVQDLKPEYLRTVLQAHLFGKEHLGKPRRTARISRLNLERLSVLSGGYCVFGEDLPIFLPECCGAVCDHFEWQKALDLADGEATQIWIGHPMLHCRRRGGYLQFVSNGAEDVVRDADGFSHKIALEGFAAVVAEMGLQFGRFRAIVIEHLRAMGAMQAAAIADRICGVSRYVSRG